MQTWEPDLKRELVNNGRLGRVSSAAKVLFVVLLAIQEDGWTTKNPTELMAWTSDISPAWTAGDIERLTVELETAQLIQTSQCGGSLHIHSVEGNCAARMGAIVEGSQS